jgi:hypothetical protein
MGWNDGDRFPLATLLEPVMPSRSVFGDRDVIGRCGSFESRAAFVLQSFSKPYLTKILVDRENK